MCKQNKCFKINLRLVRKAIQFSNLNLELEGVDLSDWSPCDERHHYRNYLLLTSFWLDDEKVHFTRGAWKFLDAHLRGTQSR